MKTNAALVLALATLLPAVVLAQSSSCGPAPSNGIRPSIASGYSYQVLATGLSKPRGILFDEEGNLLVVEQGRGVISAHTLTEENGCISIGESTDVTDDLDLNHGIEISSDGATLYASNSNDVYSWAYDASARTVSAQRILVTNMTGAGHVTRTLLLSESAPGMLVVSKGSFSNIDIEATNIESGSSQVKAFNLTNATSPYDYDFEGLLLGWGLRNEVGIAEHPGSGGIFGIENSVDQMTRRGVDISRDNPGEELNFLGYLDGKEFENQGGNFGYPWCYAAWDPEALPDNEGLSVGSQFAIDPSQATNNENRTDEYCAEQVPPRLTFQAHMAPLDIKFNNSGQEGWIAWHGSWDRSDPIGYKLSVVAWTEDGEPVDEPDSNTAAIDIFGNEDLSACPGKCHRPVAMAFDSQGRIFLTSDTSGEIYVVTRTDESGSPAGSPTSSGTATPSATDNAANTLVSPLLGQPLGLFASILALLLWWI